MKAILSIAALVAIALVGFAIAQEKSGSCPGTCASSDSTLNSTESGEGTCASSCAVAKLPEITYQVDGKPACCANTAKAMAEKSEKPITYVVAEKTYDDKTEAYTALVEETEAFVDAFITPKECEVSGQTTIAGKSCGCCVEAGERAELVSAAVNEVKMTYKVGEEEVCCSTMAAQLAEKTGDETHFVVDGEETACNLTARLNLAKAKYEAAVKALAAADQPEEPAETADAGTPSESGT